MPRRRQDNIYDINNNLLELVVAEEPSFKLVKDHLRIKYFEMMKKSREKMECAICLNEIDCVNCFALGVCGHAFHLHEALRVDKCPICRS